MFLRTNCGRTQSVTDMLPDGDDVPEGQGVQDVAPEVDEKVPVSHGLHHFAPEDDV